MLYVVLTIVCLFSVVVAVTMLTYLQCSHVARGAAGAEVDDAMARLDIGARKTVAPKLSASQHVTLAGFVIFKLLYSFLFTFTTLFVVVSVWCYGDARRLMHAGNFLCCDAVEARADAAESTMRRELRQQASTVRTMRAACDGYVDERYVAATTQTDRVTNDNNNRRALHDYTVDAGGDARLVAYRHDVERFSDRYRHLVADAITPLQRALARRLNHTFSSRWLMFPLAIFNDTRWQAAPAAPAAPTDAPAKFWEFLELWDVESRRNWSLALQKR